MDEPLLWLHPIGGLIAVFLIFWLGLQGVRSRHSARYAVGARARHARFSWYIYGYVGCVAAAGLGTVVGLRTDLSPARSAHFCLMAAVVGLLSFEAISSRAFGVRPAARTVHRLVGIATLTLALVGAALGLGLLPG